VIVVQYTHTHTHTQNTQKNTMKKYAQYRMYITIRICKLTKNT